MSDSGLARRKQLLLDKFLAGEIDKATYDDLLSHLTELDSAVAASQGFIDPASQIPSDASFVVTESKAGEMRSAFSAPIPLLDAGMELGGFKLERRLRRGRADLSLPLYLDGDDRLPVGRRYAVDTLHLHADA